MTEDRMAPIEAIQKADDGDFTPALAETVPRIIMDSDIEALVGVGRHERADRRLTYRNGYRDRILETRLGALNPRIAKLRQGSYVPGCTADASPAFCCTQPGQIEHPVHPGQHMQVTRSDPWDRTLMTRVGKLEPRGPRDRDGRFSTELVERYQRSERALVAALAAMYVQVVSTRKSLPSGLTLRDSHIF